MQYGETLPLADKEVVLTFDDGPLPPYTPRVLEILAKECVKATFFIVGRQARAFPELVRRVFNDGHTVGTHSQNHPFNFAKLPPNRARAEIDDGIASTAAALGDPAALAPFFRFPGLGRSAEKEAMLGERHLMTWSADFPADDWRRIGAKQVLARALERLEKKGKGVLLLHDIQPATVLALPLLLRELKARGYRIVHVEPARSDRPKTVTHGGQWVSNPSRATWPRVVETAHQAEITPGLPVPSTASFSWPNLYKPGRLAASRRPLWPSPLTLLIAGMDMEATVPRLPIPSPQSFGVPHPFGPRFDIVPVSAPLEKVTSLAPSTLNPLPAFRHLAGPALR